MWPPINQCAHDACPSSLPPPPLPKPPQKHNYYMVSTNNFMLHHHSGHYAEPVLANCRCCGQRMQMTLGVAVVRRVEGSHLQLPHLKTELCHLSMAFPTCSLFLALWRLRCAAQSSLPLSMQRRPCLQGHSPHFLSHRCSRSLFFWRSPVICARSFRLAHCHK